jgi:hypothetical protein
LEEERIKKRVEDLNAYTKTTGIEITSSRLAQHG